ncbi:MAG: sulfite exporter TauE/SafE family protein [Pirellulales bacterium]|nr:sulfite exporter TauE/SafE family protein [Pirellulales bacterium]
MGEFALVLGIFLAAMLYSSVGHGGASGYLAAMALAGVAPESMRPAALALNILVASIATVRFCRRGRFSWSLFWPFAAASIPMAYLGGRLTVPGGAYKVAVGVVLLMAAARLAWNPSGERTRSLPLWLGLLCGAGIGLLSGLTGVGGGIFLSPLLVIAGWADPKHASGVSAAFIVVNSVAGLLGLFAHAVAFPAALPYWAAAAAIGGVIGSELGSKRLANPALRRVLAVVLLVAGLKMALA